MTKYLNNLWNSAPQTANSNSRKVDLEILEYATRNFRGGKEATLADASKTQKSTSASEYKDKYTSIVINDVESIKTVLRKGSTDTGSVKKLQELLKGEGLYYGKADGKMNSNTEKAVKWFQQSRGLKVDGVVGPATWKALAERRIATPILEAWTNTHIEDAATNPINTALKAEVTSKATKQAGTGIDKTGADKTGTDKTGTDKTGADKTGTDKTGADKTGTDKTGAGKPRIRRQGT